MLLTAAKAQTEPTSNPTHPRMSANFGTTRVRPLHGLFGPKFNFGAGNANLFATSVRNSASSRINPWQRERQPCIGCRFVLETVASCRFSVA